MYNYSFITVNKDIFVVKVISKVIQFLFKQVIISIDFHFKLVSNYFELYEKSNENYTYVCVCVYIYIYIYIYITDHTKYIFYIICDALNFRG